MARIQPSFLHFYLFRTRQHNTSFLLTSKDKLRYPRRSFLSNPKLLLSFSIVNRVHYLFIYLVNYISPSRTIQNRVHKSFGTYNEIVKILHIYSLSPIPFQIYSSIEFQTPFQGDLHNSAWPQTCQYFNKISKPFLGEFALPVPQDSQPLSRGRSSQNLVCFSQYPRYQSHSRETSQNTSNFHNFSKHWTRPTALTTDPKVYEHSPDNIIDTPKSSQISD